VSRKPQEAPQSPLAEFSGAATSAPPLRADNSKKRWSPPSRRGPAVVIMPGVNVNDSGRGTFEDVLTGNGVGAWDIDKGSEPNVTLARNKE
jgi:hypothetical protein